ncbi:hypothetical protein ACOSQ3_005078 [Xanthoceras sorbifolium]
MNGLTLFQVDEVVVAWSSSFLHDFHQATLQHPALAISAVPNIKWRPLDFVFSPAVAEATAVHRSLIFAHELGVGLNCLETDASSAIGLINGSALSFF